MHNETCHIRDDGRMYLIWLMMDSRRQIHILGDRYQRLSDICQIQYDRWPKNLKSFFADLRQMSAEGGRRSRDLTTLRRYPVQNVYKSRDLSAIIITGYDVV